MNQVVPVTAPQLPALIVAAGENAQLRFLEFFTANIRNRNTRRAYAQAVAEFLAWCEHHRVPSITAVQPMHVAGYIEELTRARSAPTAKQRLSAIRHLFDWLVVGQVMPVNPAASVRGPSHVVKRGKTPVLSPEEARRVLDAIDVSTHAGLRDRALIALERQAHSDLYAGVIGSYKNPLAPRRESRRSPFRPQGRRRQFRQLFHQM